MAAAVEGEKKGAAEVQESNNLLWDNKATGNTL